MIVDARVMQSPATRAMKAFKQSPSSASASAPLKRHLPVPKLTSTTGTSAKTSPSTSSSDTSSGKRGLNGGKAIANRKISQGTSKDTAADARVSSSESSVETTGTEFIQQGTKDAPAAARHSVSESAAESTGTEYEASKELSFECVEPDATKRIANTAEPSLLIPGLQLKDLDVVHSNLAVSWFNLDDNAFDDFLNTKADQNPYTTSSEKQKTLCDTAEATATPKSILESFNNGCIDEFGGAIGRVFSTNTPLQQDEKCEDGKAVLKELTNLETPDVTQCVGGKDNTLKCEDASTLLEKSEGKGEVKLACENLMRQAGHGIDALRGWRGIKFLLPASVFILYTVLLCVDNLIEGELDTLPPPT